ncbi:ClpP-like prohead protease/major capsid protein fusion protein [Scandinavium goeteborgense]|uniref:ClpP-like prohead protease/major capsid protein fusion protein n=1 Tax=Scandinavium goeteborgense TaxID=1851514 RepID=UPI001FE3CD19|nr:ClpP-like prohead protease/major capsid protein fusion protein [Scandinavium goeteborgense]
MSKQQVLVGLTASGQVKAMDNRWYEIQAAANGSAGEIHLYDQIGGWGISASRFLREVSEAGLFNASQVEIRIHSPGGSVLDGFAIYNTLKRLTGTVNIHIDGLAASMASVIAMLPGATVHIPSNAFMMVHNPYGGLVGDASDLRDYADLLDKNSAVMIDAYTQKTGLSREDVESLMSNETWMTGAEAVDKGFADVLLPEMQMAACINENVTKEFSKMPKAAQQFFSPHANANQPQVPQPVATHQAPEQPAQPAVDVTALAVQMEQIRLKNETERRAAVSGVFTAFANHPGVTELQASCLTDQFCDAATAQQKLLAKLADGTTPGANGFVHVHAGNGNIIGDSVRNVVMVRAGFGERQTDNQFNGMSLMELARASLTGRSIGVSGMDRMGIVGMAFTHSSSDFAHILMDAASKSALLGWDEAEETFDKWTRSGELPDFKPGNRVGLEAFPSLRQVRPGAEYKYATLNDSGAVIRLATYGELFSIDRQAIINDDMSFITRIPSSMGRAAKATVGDLVYATLTENADFNGEPLFSDDRNNYISGEMNINNLASARSMMKRQKSGDRTLNISPAYLLVPTLQEAYADQIIHSTSVPGEAYNSGIKNPVLNMAEIIAEPRLDEADEHSWYLAARKGADTIEVAYLDGNAAPTVESTSGFTVDGVTMKVRIDAGVAPMDYRGMLKATGAAS